MEIINPVFVASYPREGQCPIDERLEFAFIGRSNVGKSSLINMLTARKGLAKVSATPGKTQLLNYFLIDERWFLVDLPGYGFAKVSKSKQKELSKMIDEYLLKRKTLALAFVLIDCNVPPQKIDLDFINSLGEMQVPFAICFTKSDRPGKKALHQGVAAFLKALKKYWDPLPPHFITSSEHKTGRRELLNYIGEVINTAPEPEITLEDSQNTIISAPEQPIQE
jgi:GTP-binding protein